jgi:hypothetical protein
MCGACLPEHRDRCETDSDNERAEGGQDDRSAVRGNTMHTVLLVLNLEWADITGENDARTLCFAK